MRHASRPDRRRATARLITLLLMGAIGLSAPSRAEFLMPDRHRIEALGDSYGPDAADRLHRWRELVAELPAHERAEQLRRVNAFINAVRFVDDAVHWGQEDYWATPAELLGSNGGDCEDLAIAKYFTLRAAGIPAARMRITYVKATTVDQAHMVLAYYASPDAEPLVLDNLDPEIKPASQRTDLLPVYSFNGDDLWLARRLQGTGRRVGDPQRIGRWRGLLARMVMENEH